MFRAWLCYARRLYPPKKEEERKKTRKNKKKRRRNQTKPHEAKQSEATIGEMKISTAEEAYPRLDDRPLSMFKVYFPGRRIQKDLQMSRHSPGPWCHRMPRHAEKTRPRQKPRQHHQEPVHHWHHCGRRRSKPKTGTKQPPRMRL